jgi:pimeloyl-ACP methyl ester carboxylesterase
LIGERLYDGLPGLGQGIDLSVAVPRSAALSTRTLATGLGRTVHLIHRPVDMPSGTTIAELAAWYATALRTRFDGPVDVMGTSAGGITALQLTLDHPDTVSRLAVCVAASRVSDRGRRDLLRMIRLERAGRATAWLGAGLVADGPPRVLVAGAFLLGGRRPRAVGEGSLVEAAQDWDVTDRLGEIGVPTLVLGGTRDRIVTPDLVRRTAEGIPNARLVLLPGRGHITAMFDRRTAPALRELLSR